MLVVDFDAPDRLRAFARFDAARLPPAGNVAATALLGRGHLALTVEQGGEITRYQGVAPIEGGSLEQAARILFPAIRANSDLHPPRGGPGRDPGRDAFGALAACWRNSCRIRRSAGAWPISRPATRQQGFHVARLESSEEENWTEAQALAATVEDHELLDPGLSSEGLAYRLFHERGVRVFPAQPLRDACRCSDERVESMLRGFSQAERDDMVGEDGMIGVTCEFCSTLRRYDPKDFRDG